MARYELSLCENCLLDEIPQNPETLQFQPKVLEDYLDGEFSVIDELLRVLDAFDKEGDFRNAFYQYLRRYWHLGRSAAELTRIVAASPKLAAYEVADTMCVSATAVSGWQNGTKGITAENMEVLRRYFGERIQDLPEIGFLLDLAGYIRLIGEMRKPPDDDIVPILPMLQFWRLWQILRSPLWFKAFVLQQQHLKSAAIKEVNRSALQFETWYESLSAADGQNVKRKEALSEATEIELTQLAGEWLAAFAVAFVSLDHVCWTEPNE